MGCKISFSNFAVKSIANFRAPDLLAPGSEHLVKSQLNFGNSGKVQTAGQVRLDDKARMAGHVAQLEELEHLLESTESLSPLTLEMVETALVGLKQKRAEHLSRKEVQARNPNTVAEQDIKSFFPHPEHIAVKGNAPLLVPHPGDNMVPMTDAAIDKQNKLRGLRHEMIMVIACMFSKFSPLMKLVTDEIQNCRPGKEGNQPNEGACHDPSEQHQNLQSS